MNSNNSVVIIGVSAVAVVFAVIIYIFSGKGPLPPGSCVAEINKKYFSSSDGGTVYKIETVKGNSYAISMYNDERWDFIADKPLNYFQESEAFKYDKVPCPMANSERSGKKSNNLKSLEIN